MTGNGAKIRIAEEKSPVEVCRKSAKMLDHQRIGMLAKGGMPNGFASWGCSRSKSTKRGKKEIFFAEKSRFISKKM